MPVDGKGKFHMNPNRARLMGGGPPKEPEPGSPKDSGGMSAASTTLHDHGDGTYHTEDEAGQRTDHASLGDALAHMAGAHGDDALSNHIASHGGGMSGSVEHKPPMPISGAKKHALMGI